MALVSVVPLVSKLCLRKSLFSSTHEVKAIHRAIPNSGMCRQGKSMIPSISMSSTTSVSNDDGVQRHIGDYHCNLWDDNFINSLSTSYEASSDREHVDRLIGEVKDMFNSLLVEDGELINPLNDLLQRLWMVDSVERLGIDRNLKNEIKSTLDYVYRYPLDEFNHMRASDLGWASDMGLSVSTYLDDVQTISSEELISTTTVQDLSPFVVMQKAWVANNGIANILYTSTASNSAFAVDERRKVGRREYEMPGTDVYG